MGEIAGPRWVHKVNGRPFIVLTPTYMRVGFEGEQRIEMRDGEVYVDGKLLVDDEPRPTGEGV
jgi:hypothetical protein